MGDAIARALALKAISLGTLGVAGPKGDKGDQGLQGIQGIQGATGAAGANGAAGAAGVGVPTGGAAGQVLAKVDGTNHNTQWIDHSSSGNGDGAGYVVQLSRWRITQGLPTKTIENISGVDVSCYSNADYAIAYNNILGINNALSWAYSNGYRYVTMPTGTYSLCMALVDDNDKLDKIVINYDNFTFDLNGSTFRVMFDSVKRSPYDKTRVNLQVGNNVYNTSTTEPYAFVSHNNYVGAGIFIIRDCSYATLRNGKLIGDKLDRDFSVQLEKACESTIGVGAGGNCQYITVENMDISLFMADGICTSIGRNHVFVKNGYEMGFALGNIDATGSVVASTTTHVSYYVAVSPSTPHFLHGYGSTQGMTELSNKKYSVYFYNSSNQYISSTSQFAMRSFITTKSTAFVRLVVEEAVYDSAGTGGWEMTLKTGYYGNYLTYRNNYIHHNHRGGMSQTLNDTFILNNTFYNNGERYDYENNLSGFEQPDGNGFATRYHINVEDSQGFNMFIKGNRFENGRIGIAARGYNYTITDNWFRNNIGIVLYRVHYANVKDNYFDNSDFETFPYDAPYNTLTDYIRHWYIEGNTINNFSITGNASVYSVSNNIITGKVVIQSPVHIFKSNVFKMNKDLQTPDLVTLTKVTNIDGCVFIKNVQSTAKNTVVVYDAVLTNCSFTNVKINVKNTTISDSILTDSGFGMTEDGYLKLNNCKISHGTYTLLNYYETVLENSALFNFHMVAKVYSVEIVNCDITSSSTQSIFNTYLNSLVFNISLKIKDTVIKKLANNKIGLERIAGKMDFENVTLSSAVAAANVTPNAAINHRFIDCTFTNISLITKATDITYSQVDTGVLLKPLTGTAAPTSTPQRIGQEFYDTTAKKLYKAFGTASSADWVIMN